MIADKAKNSFIRSEPVLAAHTAAAVVGYVLTSLVTHGVITADQASAVTQQVLPAVTAVLLLGLGWLVRHVVSPAAQLGDRVQEAVVQVLNAPQVAEIIARWDQIASTLPAAAAEPAPAPAPVAPAAPTEPAPPTAPAAPTV